MKFSREHPQLECASRSTGGFKYGENEHGVVGVHVCPDREIYIDGDPTRK